MTRCNCRWGMLFVAGAVVAGLAPALLAQSQLSMTVEITDARKANARLMREYTWHSRTELIMAGQVKDTRIDLVSYAPPGSSSAVCSTTSARRCRSAFCVASTPSARRRTPRST